ncbi:histidine--tRNA ligase [Priestia koreensis]|uniref:Histidine--tRNA ligase n=1 Tax=Priestia koreensis TaxID=284581 RepID=A0A0M0KZV6_9BACI|nr:histidine--tRNA ligase [Priestia koreensis]KOO44360.1 histidine--tRNA ligase [Priestia koreensis]
MKKMDYQNVKGTQDFLPEAELIRKRVKRTLEDVFMKYGCLPLETPILNYTELMASKYGGGAEILEEMYTLSDRGERDLALRYDLTIPFAKVVAMNPGLKMPFKRYEIGKVFRDGPIKTGRFREFTQCDVDVVGIESQMAEAELMVMALDAFKELNLDVIIQYNNRKLLVGLLEVLSVDKAHVNDVILTVDKVEKIGVEGVIKELKDKDVPISAIDGIERFLTTYEDSSFFERYKHNSLIQEGLAELEELQTYLDYLEVSDQCVFHPFLARGLEIYTGTIYEIFLSDQTIKSSIGSGGRYDNAIGGLVGTNETFSTVGISFGLDVIYTALERMDQQPANEGLTDYLIVPLKTEKEALLLARTLREQGKRVEIEMTGKKVGKALNRANKERIKKVIILGEKEIEQNQLIVKEMATGEEVQMTFVF